jgi:DNA-binding MarR family transcriptional regulator
MPLDSLIANPGRLRILTALAAEPRMEFVPLRQATRMTDGNLSSHAKRLHAGGLLAIDKQFRAGKPVTAYQLTDAGRRALERHVNTLIAAMSPGAATAEKVAVSAEIESDEEWVD